MNLTRRRASAGLLALALAVGAAAPVAAESDGTSDRAGWRPPATERTTPVAPAPQHRVEVLELACRPTDEGSIGCRWSAPDHPRAASVSLVRSGVDGRVEVFSTRDLRLDHHVDTTVRPGVRYRYAVRALDANGRTVSVSRPAAAAIPPVPDVEVLRLRCRPVGGTDRLVGGCEWSTPEVEARRLTLWRSVDGGAREIVASFGSPFPSTYRDVVPAGTRRVAYAVVVTVGDRIVARSRADVVAFPSSTPPSTRPEASVVVLAEAPTDASLDAGERTTAPTTASTAAPTTVVERPAPTVVSRDDAAVAPGRTPQRRPGTSEPTEAQG